MLRVLLAGLGVRGRHWAQVIQGSVRAELVALVDPAAAALERARAEFGPLPAFESVKAALAALDDVGVLVLANPPLGRQAIVEAAIARKLPLLIEKPLALDLAEAVQLVRMAEAGGVSLMVGLNFRYLAVTQAVMRLLADEVVGRTEFARFTYERWRDGRRPDLLHHWWQVYGAIRAADLRVRSPLLALAGSGGRVSDPDTELPACKIRPVRMGMTPSHLMRPRSARAGS